MFSLRSPMQHQFQKAVAIGSHVHNQVEHALDGDGIAFGRQRRQIGLAYFQDGLHGGHRHASAGVDRLVLRGKDAGTVDRHPLTFLMKHHRLTEGGEHDGGQGFRHFTKNRHDVHQPVLECRRTVNAGRFTIGSGFDCVKMSMPVPLGRAN